ncbi:unnamed protein product [Mytilus edulis]|uniref:C2H2-type domain-containing protein n=1 Tax=Mytilus edulis TaxID=6550 RepID=A0A8S3SU15_MYTED|nr:unnamed protein product [Mytilus edulis]
METCQICYKTYKDQPSLRRHTRYAHGSEFVQCQYCEYEVPANVKHRLKFHEERRHGIKKTSQKVTKKKIKSVANKVTPVEPKTSTVSHFQMTPVRSPTPVYVDMPTFNLTPDEEMLFLGRPLQTGSPVELLSLLDRPRPNHTVPSPLTAPNTTTAPVRVPDVSVQPAAVQTIPQTTPLPVTINPNSFMQAYFTATLLPAAVQATSHSHQPLPVTSTTIPQIQPYFTATPQPAAVQTSSQTTQPLPVTSTTMPQIQPYFTATPQPAAVQTSAQTTQPLPVTSTTIPQIQPYFTATPQPAAVQTSSQTTQPLPVTISHNPIKYSHISAETVQHSQHQLAAAPQTLCPSARQTIAGYHQYKLIGKQRTPNSQHPS